MSKGTPPRQRIMFMSSSSDSESLELIPTVDQAQSSSSDAKEDVHVPREQSWAPKSDSGRIRRVEEVPRREENAKAEDKTKSEDRTKSEDKTKWFQQSDPESEPNCQTESESSPRSEQMVEAEAEQRLSVAPIQQHPIVPSTSSFAGADSLMKFSIGWSMKRLSRKKSTIRMSSEEEVQLLARKLTLQQGGPCWVICETEEGFNNNGQGCVGQLFCRGRRFWMCIPNVSGESFGFCFYDFNSSNSSGRAFRIALPNSSPYVPESKEMQLSRVAKSGVENSQKYQIFSSKIPKKREDGKLVLNFGNVHMIKSVKNFIVEDKEDHLIFMIYRTTTSTCTMKVRQPLTPLMAFAVAIGIITTDN